MNVKKALDAILSRDASPVFKPGMDGILDGIVPLQFRDAEIESMYRFVRSVSGGKKITMLLHGSGGCGKTCLSRTIHDQLAGRLQRAFISCTADMTPSSFYGIVANGMSIDINGSIHDVRSRIVSITGGTPVVLFIDDIHHAKYTIRKEIMTLVKNGMSIIATATGGRLSGYRWDVVMSIPPYTRDQIATILESAIASRVNDGIVRDGFLLASIASSAWKYHEGSVSVAMKMLDGALKHLEARIIINGDTNMTLLATDIDHAASKINIDDSSGIDVDLGRNFTELFVAFAVSTAKAITMSSIMRSLRRSMEREYPGKRIPSEGTVRNVLRRLQAKDIIKQKKSSSGFSTGVKTYWMPGKHLPGLMKEMQSRLQTRYMKQLTRDING